MCKTLIIEILFLKSQCQSTVKEDKESFVESGMIHIVVEK